MASGNTWADQWDNSNEDLGHEGSHTLAEKRNDNGNGRMAKLKGVALTGLEKAKSAASVGAQKLKSGTTAGVKWVKTQYRKRASK